ncbi:MAG: hypothetical protein WA604_21675 [Candidatus Sulfotelmatobacter sp.]
MSSAIAMVMALHMCSAISTAKELPDAPSAVAVKSSMVSPPALVNAPKLNESRPAETRPVDAKFVSLAIISTGSAFADSYTTLFARQNWLAGKKGVCNIEVESAYLYGTHPTVVRTYAVASVKSVSAIAAAWYLRRHHRKLWSFPLAANSVISLQGVTQNMITCN